MKLPLTRRDLILTGTAMLITGPTLAQGPEQAPAHSSEHGASHEVQMLNRHPEDRTRHHVFYPIIQVVQPRDVVHFRATDLSHNSVSIEGMLPEGVDGWRGKLNADVSVTFTKPGFYGYKCTPHLSMGMVGLIVVQGDGMMDNYTAARAVRHRGKTATIWAEIWAQVEADGLSG